MEVEFLTAGTALPPCLPLPWAHAGAAGQQHRQGHVYARLLDAAFAAGVKDANGIIFARCPIAELAGALGRSAMTVKRALRELEDAGLLLRVRQGFGEPNKIYVLIPRDEQKQDCGQTPKLL